MDNEQLRPFVQLGEWYDVKMKDIEAILDWIMEATENIEHAGNMMMETVEKAKRDNQKRKKKQAFWKEKDS